MVSHKEDFFDLWGAAPTLTQRVKFRNFHNRTKVAPNTKPGYLHVGLNIRCDTGPLKSHWEEETKQLTKFPKT